MRKVGLFLAIILAVLAPAPVSALTQEEMQTFSQNGIYFYDPNACSSITLGIFNGESTVGLSDLQASFVDKYHDLAATLAIEYGIPWEAVMAQGILESASGTSYYATTRNNFFGIGAYDSHTDSAFSYESPEAGWRGYFENIKITPTYRNHGVFTGSNITDPYSYIQTVKSAGYATSSSYVANVSKLIAAVERRSQENGWQSSLQLAIMYPEMRTNAAANAAGADTSSGSSSSSSGSSTVICNGYKGSGLLVSGGMTLQEARAFMEPYRAITPRNYHQTGGDILSQWRINNTNCVSDLENCVAFVQYFICEYAHVCMGLPDGKNVVDRLLSIGRGFTDGGTMPQPYAIFSTTGPTKYSSSGNHTGVVLGIDVARNKIIIGEAGCRGSIDYTNAKEHDLSEYTNGSYKYAYTDGLIGF